MILSANDPRCCKVTVWRGTEKVPHVQSVDLDAKTMVVFLMNDQGRCKIEELAEGIRQLARATESAIGIRLEGCGVLGLPDVIQL